MKPLDERGERQPKTGSPSKSGLSDAVGMILRICHSGYWINGVNDRPEYRHHVLKRIIVDTTSGGGVWICTSADALLLVDTLCI